MSYRGAISGCPSLTRRLELSNLLPARPNPQSYLRTSSPLQGEGPRTIRPPISSQRRELPSHWVSVGCTSPIGLKKGRGEAVPDATGPLKPPGYSGLWEGGEVPGAGGNPGRPFRAWVRAPRERGFPPTDRRSSAPTPRRSRRVR